MVLYGTFQWSSTELNVVTLRCNKLFGSVGDGYFVAKFLDSLEQTAQFDIYNLLDCSEIELVEGDNFVQTVQEFRRKLLA